MDYRRGFQRLYAVITVAWIGGVLLATPVDRLKFWNRGTIVITEADILKERYKDLGFEPANARTQAKLVEVDPSEVSPVDGAKARDWFEENAPGVPVPESRLSKCLWLSSVLFLPPAAGYLILFQIIPWVFRGFRSGAHASAHLGTSGVKR